MVASWQFWALMSAVFAALTAIFAKIGIQGINSDFCHTGPYAGHYRCIVPVPDHHRTVAKAR
jgi:hypothetical protein